MLHSLRMATARPALPPEGTLGRAVRRARLIHPFPTALNVAATVALAFVATDGHPPAGRLLLMAVAMFTAQAAIGTTNDCVDRDLDARAKPWKPLASGLVSMRFAVLLAVALTALAVVLGAALPLGGWLLLLLGLAAGLGYDLALKRSRLSWLPYAVAIPTLPLWAWASLGEWRPVLLWLVPPGALLGLALHLANTLPDLERDAELGVRGFAHALGKPAAIAVCWSSYAAALVLVLALAPVLRYDPRPFVPGVTLPALLLATAVALYLRRRDDGALYVGWGLLAIGAAIAATGWLAAI